MSDTTTTFRRLVLELGHGAADPATIEQAAALAQWMGVEIYALFVEDEGLLRVSGLSFAREISPLSLRWRPLEQDRLEAELRAAAEQARRHLDAAALATGVKRSFEVRRGDLSSQVTEICVASDIVVVASPRRETTYGSQRWRETAHRSAASVLLLPPEGGSSAARTRGPVVAVVSGAGDPGLAVAQRIAARVGGGEVVRVASGRSAGEIIAALGDARERLIVLTRTENARLGDVAAALVAARGVPVLLVEPAARG
jgi:nucleotide-binding universal stress UspA family protein